MDQVRAETAPLRAPLETEPAAGPQREGVLLLDGGLLAKLRTHAGSAGPVDKAESVVPARHIKKAGSAQPDQSGHLLPPEAPPQVILRLLKDPRRT